MNITCRSLLISVLIPLGVGGCDVLLPDAPDENKVLDAPLDDLTPSQLGVHLAGDEAFARRFTAADGVGPIFNATSCDQCHIGEGKGHIVFNLTRFGRMGAGGFDPLRELGGPQLQDRALPGFTPESLPSEITGAAAFMPPAVTGLGFLEAVDDTTLLRLQDPDDADGDGISGRVQLVDASTVVSEISDLEALTQGGFPSRGIDINGQLIGRFGRKASAINLLHQTVNASLQDMGLTTDILPRDLLNRETGNFAEDGVADPEISSSILNSLVFYLKTLRQPLRRDTTDPEVMAGEVLFGTVGCADCHLPSLRTGASEIRQLSQVEFHPFTDLLLHDMGPELDDGYTEGRASTSEWRTTPLWGVGLSGSFQGGQGFFMHDGRATSLRDAIELHGGESAASRTRFRDLGPDDQERLLAYLRSL